MFFLLSAIMSSYVYTSDYALRFVFLCVVYVCSFVLTFSDEYCKFCISPIHPDCSVSTLFHLKLLCTSLLTPTELFSSTISQLATRVNTTAGGSNLLFMHSRACCIMTILHYVPQILQQQSKTTIHFSFSLCPYFQLVSVRLRTVCFALCWRPSTLYHWAGELLCFILKFVLMT